LGDERVAAAGLELKSAVAVVATATEDVARGLETIAKSTSLGRSTSEVQEQVDATRAKIALANRILASYSDAHHRG
jgi:hypothetical protein